MKTTVFAAGSRGDIQPCVALSQGLQRAGHDVHLAAPADFAAFVGDHGVAFVLDQPFWGARVRALGVGPAPIPRKRLTAEWLAQAITQAVTDDDLRQRGEELNS
jgi:UDP:flavonoid glycosyltransferase YjiC (YdhE family)